MLGEKISETRKKRKISQEKLAEQIGVSRQAIQKWEAGSSYPDAVNLLALAQALQVSTDALLGNGQPSNKELHLGRALAPSYNDVHIWESYQSQLLFEYRQSYDEGKDIAHLQGLFNEVARLARGDAKEQLADVLFGLTLDATQREDFPYDEPSDLDGIFNLSEQIIPSGKVPTGAALREKLHGAWMGRICGCLLGKPLECRHTDVFWPKLKETGNFPLHRYLLSSDFQEKDAEAFQLTHVSNMFIDQIDCAPIDDDTNYTVLSSSIIERYGLDFTPANVADAWVALQSKNAYCTAERVAFRNFLAGYRPPESAVYKNPYREWIGAQIRTDYYGYINPGDPRTAADMAWRDASISHVKNGIYGAMFAAAMLACAAVSNDVNEVILGGLSYVPNTSRLYEDIVKILDAHTNGVSCDDCFRLIHDAYDEHNEHDWCFTNPNAQIVVASLLYGRDYSQAICLSVQCGFDTDCNGATVGSIYGMMHGASAIGAEWTAPIHDTLDTMIFGVGKVKVPDMVDKTIQHIELKKK